MNKTYLLLGSNMGNSQKQLQEAIRQIRKDIGEVTRRSALYQTAAWGDTHQPDFLNQVIVISTPMTAAQTMQAILLIEKRMGRIRTRKNAPRIIDIDILFFNKEVIEEPDLLVPHPQLSNRRFVLIPLNELSANFIHPVLKKTIHYLLRVCPDKLAVKKI
jgi:2-amino-4-hydroxy-6-hydroxymethyldihydropteridine diphosphokinase